MGENRIKEYKDITQHPDYYEENVFLEDTFEALEELKERAQGSYESQLYTSKQYKKVHDRASSMDSIVSSVIANQSKQMKYDIENNKDNPYFARVDYMEKGSTSVEKLYIGNVSLPSMGDNARIIHYNNPVAALYYNNGTGKAKYSAPGGEFDGNISLRRQYVIKDHSLINFFEDRLKEQLLKETPKGRPNRVDKKDFSPKEEIVSDPFLIEQLKKNTDNKLNHIIQTIQREQYNVITQPLNQVTLVQGCAGSGKSTVAMHRVSYLLYNKFVSGEKVAIIAPNKLFLDYISGILPDLDIKGIKQFTIESLGEAILEEKVDIIKDEKLEFIINSDDGYLNKIVIKLIEESSRFKSSIHFKKILTKRLEQLNSQFASKLKEISLFGRSITITVLELQKYWMNDSSAYNSRIDNLKKYIENKIDAYIDKQSKFFNKDIRRLRQERNTSLSQYFLDFKKINYKNLYADILSNLPSVASDIERDILEFIKRQSLDLIKQGKIEKEDIAPLCYLKSMIIGMPSNLKFRHIVADEAQDLSLFDFSLLTELAENKAFTIMGDVSQGINSYRGIRDWELLRKEIFASQNVKNFILNQSYRSTRQIVEFCNKVLPSGLPKGNPVYRTGEKPLIEETAYLETMYDRVLTKINQYKKLGCNSIAVITRSYRDSVKAYKALVGKLNSKEIQLLTSEATVFNRGVTITSAANSKGLEFDAVIIVDADDMNYKKDEIYAKLLYVAMSRSLHYLHIFYSGNKTSLLG